MKVRLLRDARIRHYAGEIVDVSPDECHLLVTTDGAEIVNAVKTIETPEKEDPKVETPEKKAAKKAVRKK